MLVGPILANLSTNFQLEAKKIFCTQKQTWFLLDRECVFIWWGWRSFWRFHSVQFQAGAVKLAKIKQKQIWILKTREESLLRMYVKGYIDVLKGVKITWIAVNLSGSFWEKNIFTCLFCRPARKSSATFGFDAPVHSSVRNFPRGTYWKVITGHECEALRWKNVQPRGFLGWVGLQRGKHWRTARNLQTPPITAFFFFFLI